MIDRTPDEDQSERTFAVEAARDPAGKPDDVGG